jgi:hypothetical protein
MKNIQYYLGAVVLILVTGCQYEFPDDTTQQPGAGEADFTKVIAVGNSLTAGYMDGALYNRGQENSFIVILAEQMKAVGGGEFNLPNINSENGLYSLSPSGSPLGRLVLTTNPNTGSVSPAPIGPGDLPSPFAGDKAALNNFGVPCVTIGMALIPEIGIPNHDWFNPLYARIASNPGTSTLIGDAAAALANGGTFFSFWLGNNDVYGYALSGAANPAALTSNENFQMQLNAALGAILSANPTAKGIIMNIPSVDLLPHFNLINPLAISLPAAVRPELGAGIAQLNAAINGWNAGVNANPQLPEPVKASLIRPLLSDNFDAYPLLILDPSLSDAAVPLPTGGTFTIPKIRNLIQDDEVKLPLTAQTALGEGVGISPLSPLNEAQYDALYLTKAEQEEIRTKINTFNGYIAAAAQAQPERLLLIDVNEFLTQVSQGLVSFGNIGLTASIVPPTGAFSVDGIHPNGRAHAFIANLIIEKINEKWGATLPKTNPNAFPGNDLPR